MFLLSVILLDTEGCVPSSDVSLVSHVVHVTMTTYLEHYGVHASPACGAAHPYATRLVNSDITAFTFRLTIDIHCIPLSDIIMGSPPTHAISCT